MPYSRPYTRPTQPKGTKSYGGSLFSNILGLAIGSAFYSSIDYLYDNGYSVKAYGDDVVYLNNVKQMGYTWSNGTLYFDNGSLTASEFVNATTYSDFSRYSALYNQLTSSYGLPLNQNTDVNARSATWWGQNQYITLTYGPYYANNGTLYYYTMLTLGK
jgi:hypothetical protein